MTIDEELVILETQLRRLKIEYEMFFNNPTKKPPTDVEWKVLSLLRKFSDGKMSFSQRYRYNEMAQRYAVYSDLWRKKARIREEGYRHPAEALLSVQGVRVQPHEVEHKVYGVSAEAAALAAGVSTAHAASAEKPFSVQCSDPLAERDQVERLYNVLTEAKRRRGEPVTGNMESFSAFVQKKTDQIRKEYGCPSVEYSVEMQDGHVKLKARAKA